MTMISEIMSRDVQIVGPNETVQRAARLMGELDVGALPVCDGRKLVGMLTDRDITIRATAAGLAPGETRVRDIMSGDVAWCEQEESNKDVLQRMGTSQIRRVPVVNERRELVGIVSLGDLALNEASTVSEALRDISAPPQAGPGSETTG
jgi:CBS domain-containing protein